MLKVIQGVLGKTALMEPQVKWDFQARAGFQAERETMGTKADR